MPDFGHCVSLDGMNSSTGSYHIVSSYHIVDLKRPNRLKSWNKQAYAKS